MQEAKESFGKVVLYVSSAKVLVCLVMVQI
jgi:hypothetical protein